MKKRAKNLPGFTLIELLIYMGIFMGFLVILSGLFVSTLEVQNEASQTARIEQDSHYVYTRMQYDISRATTLTTPATNGETAATLVLSVTEGEIVYTISNGKIMLSLDGGTPQPLTSPEIVVTQLSFQKLGNQDGVASIRVHIQLESNPVGSFSPEIRDLTYTFGMR